MVIRFASDDLIVNYWRWCQQNDTEPSTESLRQYALEEDLDQDDFYGLAGFLQDMLGEQVDTVPATVHTAATDPRLEDFGDVDTGNGRWHYPYSHYSPNTYLSGEGRDVGVHHWHIAPTDAPATWRGQDKYGHDSTLHYDPERAHIEPGEFCPHAVPNDPDALTDHRNLPDPGGTLWRGMSHEEYEQAKERGYFESNHSYNLGVNPGDYQNDKTFFSDQVGQAAHYATGFAPWQYQPTFTRPAHVVGIPDRPELPRGAYPGDRGSHEVGVPGHIPFNSVTHHWVGNVAAINPGTVQNNTDYGEWGTPSRSLSPRSEVQWEHEEAPSIHSGQLKSGPWLLEASMHVAYDIQSPAPGEPVVTKRGPVSPPLDPTNDPMGDLNARPYNYNTMVDNLVSHYHGANDNERKQGRLWYKAAHDLFHKFAKDNNITPERAVGYGSAFSPLTDWGDNIHHAQKFMLGYKPTLEDGSPNPDFNPHDWQTAHIAQEPLDAFRQEHGRDPTHSDEDLHALADLHQGQWPVSKADAKKGLLGKHDIANNPEARQRWMENIQHKGMPAVLEDQARQAEAWRKSPKTTGPYNPDYSMRASGINTLGANVQKAKNLYHAPDDVVQMFKVLGGPKISHFTDNILDDTPIDSEGYYQHPNGDWTQNKDLGGTIDSHHVRASSMPHGGWERKPYASKNPSTDHEYDVFNRGLLDATRRINDGESDPTRHITPKQLQAIIWLKHKNDKDYFERQRNPQTGQLISHESELGGVGRPEDWQYAEKSYKSKGKGLGKGPSRAAALDDEDFQDMPPLWRKMFMSRRPEEWTDLLSAWVNHHSSYPPEEPPSIHSGQLKSGPWLLEASEHEATEYPFAGTIHNQYNTGSGFPDMGWINSRFPGQIHQVGGGGGGGSGGGGHSSGDNSSGSGGGGGYKPVSVTGNGADAADSYAKQMNGRPYNYGGVGSGSGVDCSGAASSMYAYMTGKDPNVRHFSTTSDFPSLGFQPGYQPGAFNIGVNPQPGMSGHMATTLPNGTNVESGGPADKFQYGGTAAGAQDKQFSQQWHLPASATSAPSTPIPATQTPTPATQTSVVSNQPDQSHPEQMTIANRTKFGSWLLEALDYHSPGQRPWQVKDRIPSDYTWLEPTDTDWFDNGSVDWPEDDPRYEDPDYDPQQDPSFDPTPRQRSINHEQLNRRQRKWYHVSPHEIEPGTELEPMAKPSYDSERGMYKKREPVSDELENPLGLPPDDTQNRGHYVFMAPQLQPAQEDFRRFQEMNPQLDEESARKYFDGQPTDATWWKKHMYDVRPGWKDQQPANIYEVKPHGQPKPWNLNYGQGYATPGATVIRKVDPSEYSQGGTMHPSRWYITADAQVLNAPDWGNTSGAVNPDDEDQNKPGTHAPTMPAADPFANAVPFANVVPFAPGTPLSQIHFTPNYPTQTTSHPSAGGGGGGTSAPSVGGGSPSAAGGTPSSSNPAGGAPSPDLASALQRAGIDPAMHPLISGFSKVEGNNPSGVPTLGFTDSQAGTTLDQHAQALAKQLKDRQPVAGSFPANGSPQQQASWMATVVGQSGVKSDWQGNAQPARSDYVNRVVTGMPPTVPRSPAVPKASSIHSGQLKSGPWLLEASTPRHSSHEDPFEDTTDLGEGIPDGELTETERLKKMHAASKYATGQPGPNITYGPHPSGKYPVYAPHMGGMVHAYDTNLPGGPHEQEVGHLHWNGDESEFEGMDYGEDLPEITHRIGEVEVHPDYQRHGIAAGMLDYARKHDPQIHHSDELTDDGEAWSRAMKRRKAQWYQ